MNAKTESIAKPRFALLIATGFGLGYLPIAPGTWGSLGGVALEWLLWVWSKSSVEWVAMPGRDVLSAAKQLSFAAGCILGAVLAAIGVWTAGRVERHSGRKDPQFVVIDEISGQQLTLVLGLGWTVVPNWKYLLLGFILFRVFDIWKPFPVRRLEALPGGWGIMADDWCAAVYAAVVLWLARGLGL